MGQKFFTYSVLKFGWKSTLIFRRVRLTVAYESFRLQHHFRQNFELKRLFHKDFHVKVVKTTA